uniref:Chemokine (C-C motif) ligand 19 n=1 Tax=Takifugu rubripes TaxID=31033 RepID=E1CFF9_TAKRU|nr:chemokine (C-C motif) ligand 19 [Takifugu rubripes]
MAPSGDAKLLFCIFFISCCCLTVTLAEVPVDCCLSVGKQQVIKHAIVDYHRQVAGQGCSLNATILVTRRQVRLCVPANEQWVEKVVEHVEKLRAHCRKNKYKKPLCSKMMPRN